MPVVVVFVFDTKDESDDLLTNERTKEELFGRIS